jgi:F-type H+-transporting ATPase subunit a
MPQSRHSIIQTKSGKSFQIAQGGPAENPPGETRTSQEPKGEKKHEIGEIPDPHLLLYNSILVVILLIVFGLAARRQYQAVPKGFANFAEFVAEALNKFTVGIIGHGGEKYTPLAGTVFLYILLMNLIGVIPGFHSPTGNLTFTFAIGLVVFLYVQYEGIRQNGIVGYVKHFMGPMPAMSPLMLIVELISEFVKPFTLAIRLFGNIFGEDVIIVVLAGLLGTLGLTWLGWFPAHFIVLPLSIITAVVQAMVFSILTCIYLSLMSHHGHDDHGNEGPIDEAHSHASGH